MYGFCGECIAVYRQTAGQVMGYSTLENILHCKVVSWEPELPETRIVTIRTPCYVYVDILPNMKSIFSVPVVPVIPFGGEKNGVPYLWCVATPVDASIKLQKIRCNS